MRVRPWLVPLALTATALTATLGGCHRAASDTGAPAAKVAIAASYPAPVSGLWVQKIADGQTIAITRYCLDDAAARSLTAFGRGLEARCQRRDMAPGKDGWRFATACNMGGWGSVASEGVAHGDFDHHYTVEVQAHTSGANAPSANGARRISAEISWQGACPKDMKPGDIVWPDGRRSRLDSLAAPS